MIEGREEDFPNPNYDPTSSDWRQSRETVTHSSRASSQGTGSPGPTAPSFWAKVNNLTGTWPAIWTFGVDCSWPSNGESRHGELQGDILANSRGTNTPWTPNPDSSRWPVSCFRPGWVDEFHIWELGERVPNDHRPTGPNSTKGPLTTTNGMCLQAKPFQRPFLLRLALGAQPAGRGGLSSPPLPIDCPDLRAVGPQGSGRNRPRQWTRRRPDVRRQLTPCQPWSLPHDGLMRLPPPHDLCLAPLLAACRPRPRRSTTTGTGSTPASTATTGMRPSTPAPPAADGLDNDCDGLAGRRRSAWIRWGHPPFGQPPKRPHELGASSVVP